jgi:hypothetical protein
VGRLAHGYPTLAQGRPQDVLSTLRIPLAELIAREPSLDTTRLGESELSYPGPGSSIGSVWLADVELAIEDAPRRPPGPNAFTSHRLGPCSASRARR